VNGKKMSKSTGNVYYPNNLLEKGFSGEQLRFFLIYGPYREKLNFTMEKLAETSSKLDSLKNMIKELQEQESDRFDPKMAVLIRRLVSDFENAMSDDLSVKSAFDELYETVSELHKNLESLSKRDVKKVIDNLYSIDSVLQCIF
jgi:cysteinyl-tRNA synthetase